MYKIQYFSKAQCLIGKTQIAHFKTLKQARDWFKAGLKDGSYKLEGVVCMQHHVDVTAWFLEGI